MKLSQIKMSGFKSFVDTTTINISNDRTGVVGPNGCGKSNIIDAVKWVMGDTSKHIRGGSLEDVIFNGTDTRKPNDYAFVELIFSNTENKIGGEFAKYDEISIKREASRDGNSKYFLNNSHCRRRDIIDIFLGTGLGPKSYAIINQGTASKLIESKPEEFRVFIEEVAGISKYRERKKETESKLLDSKSNLDRVEDILKEINKRLFELKKQSEDADKFKKLNEEYEKITQLINKIPSDDEIRPLIEKSKKLKTEEETLITKMNILREERGKANGPMVKLNIELKNEYEKKSAKDIHNLDNKRFIDYSVKVKDILSSFHVKALDYHIKRLEKLILNCFKSLHRKKNFIKSIKIDTIEFDLKISDKKDTEVNTEDLSAGERQLLAVAILWGLAKASNSAAPTIIDTPLGRLDSEHRFNLVEQYFPTASKQVILLSTDEEINKKYHKFISPYLSRSYKIEYDEKLSGSKLSEGYFF